MNDDYEVINDVITQALANLHTIVVGKVTAVNATTVDVKPSMARVVDGEAIQLPTFASVPPVFLRGGTSYLSMPVEVGDSCLLLISERCFDTWYIGQDGVAPLEARMHDYSDGFALVGIHVLSEALKIPKVIELIGELFAEGLHTHIGDMIRTGMTTLNGALNIVGAPTTSDSTADFAQYLSGGVEGVSGVFASADNKVITVTNGIITGID